MEMLARYLASVAEVLHLDELRSGMLYALGLVVGLGALFYILERFDGADTRRYFSRAFLTEVIYTFVYRGGIFAIFIFAPVAGLLNLDAARQMAPSSLPAPLAILAYLVVGDFLAYWIHRLQHAVPFLWALHSIHHSARQLTFLTISRAHILEGFILFLPGLLAMYICGVPPKMWGPLAFLRIVHEFCLHSELTWRFGPLYRVIIGPMFHGQHHSKRPEEHDKNFGSTLGIWDWLFGTLAEGRERPKEYGVEGMDLPESFWRHQLEPFRRLLARRKREEPLAAAAARESTR